MSALKVKRNHLMFLCQMFLLAIFLGACGESKRVEKIVAEMKSAPIAIPKDEMFFYDNNSELDTAAVCDFKMVVYVNRSRCSTCFISHLSMWADYLELEKEGKVKLFFIMEVPQSEIEYYCKKTKYSRINHPIYFDMENRFKSKNPQIPSEEKYHVFLLDKNNKIVLVGNPLTNHRIGKLFKKVIDEREDSLSNKRIDSVQ